MLFLLLGGCHWLWSSCLWGPVWSWFCNKVCGSLPPSLPQRSVVTQLAPSGQPLQPHHFPSLGGMTVAGSREKRRMGGGEGGCPSIGRPQMRPVCLADWNLLYIQYTNREAFRQTGRVCLCILKWTPHSHMAPLWSLDRSSPSHVSGVFFLRQDTHLHTAVIQTFMKSEACCPLISLSQHTVCSWQWKQMLQGELLH